MRTPAILFGRFRRGRWRSLPPSRSALSSMSRAKSCCRSWRRSSSESCWGRRPGDSRRCAFPARWPRCCWSRAVTLIITLVILLIVPRVSELTNGLPGIVSSLKEKLHVFDGVLQTWRRVTSTVTETPKGDAVALPLPGISWAPWTISILLPPITGFLFFLVVLLLFIGAWPDLRRALVMTFASRDLRLTVLKILNEIEAGLANYLLIVTLINICVGVLTGVICALTSPECDRIWRPGRRPEFHPDHRTDHDFPHPPPGRDRHCADPRSRSSPSGRVRPVDRH